MIFCVVMVSFSGHAVRNSGDHSKMNSLTHFGGGSIAEVNKVSDEKSSFLRRRYIVPIRIEELQTVIFQYAELQDVLKGTTYPEMVLDGGDLSSLQKYVFLSAFSSLRQSSRLKFPMCTFFSLLALLLSRTSKSRIDCPIIDFDVLHFGLNGCHRLSQLLFLESQNQNKLGSRIRPLVEHDFLSFVLFGFSFPRSKGRDKGGNDVHACG